MASTRATHCEICNTCLLATISQKVEAILAKCIWQLIATFLAANQQSNFCSTCWRKSGREEEVEREREEGERGSRSVHNVADLRNSLARHNRDIKMRLKCGRLSVYLALAPSLYMPIYISTLSPCLCSLSS